MVLIHAAEGESQDKLQRVRKALGALRGTSNWGRTTVGGVVTRYSLLFKRTKLSKLLVQFAYDVNHFFRPT